MAMPATDTGVAYVAVSAQPLGIRGFPSRPQGLITWDPERYGTLHIADDARGYDIFTQIARLLREPAQTDAPHLLGPLHADVLIGVGASQSGTRILAYTNAVQPVERAYDALMPLINAGMAADFEPALAHPDRAAGQRGHSRALPTRVREDLTTPVLALNTNTEAAHYAAMRQPDTDYFRSWEIAGASHGPSPQLRALRAITRRDGMSGLGWADDGDASEVPWLPTFDAAVEHMRRWVIHATPAPAQPPIAVDGNTIVRDEHCNATGGIRLPELEVPLARYRGSTPSAPLAGSTEPLPPETIARLYPTHETYLAKVLEAARAAHDAGVITWPRAVEYGERARTAPIPPQ